MNDPNLPSIKQDSSAENNNSGNMYSYRDENNINNPKELESGAIRRSIGEGNPNTNFPKSSFNPGYEPNYINNNPVPIKYSKNLNDNTDNSILNWAFCLIFGIVEILMIILIAIFFKWDIRNDPKYTKEINGECKDSDENIIEILCNSTESELNEYYGLFRDINIMIFVGFGMLHALLKKYSWTSISINMIAIVFSFQIGLFTNLLWKNAFKEKWKAGLLNFKTLIQSNFNSCSVLISLGCVLGKLSIIQYLIMIILETIFSSLNFQLCLVKLKAIDVGGSLYIHTFGAIFGLAIYMVLFCSTKMKTALKDYSFYNNGNYFSHIIAFIGVIFIWCYFPSFNAGLAFNNNYRYRSTINTYLSLSGSVVGSFIASALYNKGRYVIEQILFGSFSGGVIISGCSTVCIDHYASLILGFLCSGICVTFLSKIKPFFINWGYEDIFNIIIIHGIPGLLSSFITPMMIGDFQNRYIKNNIHYLIFDDERTSAQQAGIQIGAIFITIAISFTSGIATGYLMKIATCGKIDNYFIDSEFFVDNENIINNFEDNQILPQEITDKPFLFQNKMEFPPQQSKSDFRGSQPSYN